MPDGPIRQFYERLHALHTAAGQPSMRQLQRRTRAERRPAGLNPTTIHHAFIAPRLARWEVVRAIVEALGGDVDEFGGLWRRARQAEAEHPNAEASGQPAEPGQPSGEPPEEAPPPVVPRELPPDVSAFTGRTAQLAQLDALLGAGGGPATAVVICAVAGAAGVGKTSLAIHWGHQAAQRFPDGQLYVNLRGFDSGPPVRPVEALAQLLRSLGVPADRIPADEPAAAGLYRSLLAGRRVLLVLDNAATADQVRPLLPGVPGCLALVTSRNRLTALVARDGARALPVDVLAPEEAGQLLTELLDPALVAAEPDSVAALAEACGHLPLALRITAANLAAQPEPSLAGQVAALRGSQDLSTLEIAGDETAGIRSAFELSYRALPAAARRLFRLLGLVPGPDVPVAAAAALADLPAERARSLLAELTTVHLVTQTAPDRFACHDLLRRYAADRAGADETPAGRQEAQRRLEDWYLYWADAAAGLLYPHRLRLPVPPLPRPATPVLQDEASALAWLDAERPNLVAVVRNAAERGSRATAWLLADTLRSYFWLGMHAVDWAMTAEVALAAALAEQDVVAEAATRLSLGDLHFRRDEPERAAEHYGQAWEGFRRTGRVAGQIAALGNLGVIHRDLGRLQLAADYLGRALALCRAYGSSYAEAITLDCLGRTYWHQGRLAEATGCFTDALALNRKLGARLAEAACLGDLGEILLAQGRAEEAEEHVTSALELLRSVGDRGNEAASLRVLALVYRDTGRLEQAAEAAEAAAGLARELASRRTEADALNCLGGVRRDLGQPEVAVAHHQRALALARAIGDRYLEVDSRIELAAAQLALGHAGRAGAGAREALVIAEELGYARLASRARAVSAALPREPR